MNLDLRKFSMRQIRFDKNESQGPIIIMIGRRGTGKSVLIQDVMYYHQSIPSGTVISGTEEGNGFFGRMVPHIFIHTEYHVSIIERVLLRQQEIMKRWTGELTTYKKTSIDPRTFLIMDDCLYDETWTREKLMRYVFMNGRHRKIMFILTMQYPLGIPPALRTNIDYAFLLRDTIVANQKRLYDAYAGMFETFDEFRQVFNQVTTDYGCLVIDYTSKSNQLTDQIFWYKAAVHEPYRLGAPEFWELSRTVEERHSGAEYDPKRSRKRSSVAISVNKKR